ncbi:glycosyltransferase family 2 protein [Marinomonas algarum]|uniref:Glycosyltransferase family 2 protein n=1 Tax=Marinomonas algarum TaxID=2883105 RepID=A0A9X1IPG7_9GAMM|nr:glycosyltransferase family 2 protein [Marinomonas algarum]MCB5161513.1 glycosyltransferase family 2 protein [Marinomonas algarum]
MLRNDLSISIIIPAYNVEKYLYEALDSIKSQTCMPDEVILIDDGSSDKTLEIAKSFKFTFPYRVVSIENGGQGNARNIGISLSNSEYVYFFDSDDLLVSSFVSDIKGLLRDNYKPDIVLFSGESFNDPDYKGNRWVSYCRGFTGFFNQRADLLASGLESKGLFCSPCMYISKKLLWGKDKLEFGAGFFEDEAILFPLLFSCNSFLVIDDVYFLRRNRENSTMTMKVTKKHVDGALNCIETNLNLLNRLHLTAEEQGYIKKRIEDDCIRYILTARRAESNLNYKRILSIAIATRNVSLFLKFSMYFMQLDQLKFIRKIGKIVLKSR